MAQSITNPNQRRLISKRFYVYNTVNLALAAGGTAQSTITVAKDSDFFLAKMCMFADIVGATQTDSTRVIPLVTVQITESSSGNSMFDRATPVAALFGYGSIPFILPEPKLFEANASFVVDLSNFSAATAYNVRLSFIGYRAYYNN